MAQALVADYGGEVPNTMEQLIKLPGVGARRRTWCWEMPSG
jgi:endonuclease-3